MAFSTIPSPYSIGRGNGNPWFVQNNNHKMGTTQLPACGCDGAPDSYQASFIDKNGDGKFQHGVDSVILTDINKDGKYDWQDAEQTSQLLNLARNRKDPNIDGDGGVFGWFPSSDGERKQAQAISPKLPLVDPNGDGKVTAEELTQGCQPAPKFRLAADGNLDGKFTGTDFAPEQNQSLQQISDGRVFTTSWAQKPKKSLVDLGVDAGVGVLRTPGKLLLGKHF